MVWEQIIGVEVTHPRPKGRGWVVLALLLFSDYLSWGRSTYLKLLTVLAFSVIYKSAVKTTRKGNPMVLIVWGVPILVGFVLGYFFAQTFLILSTVVCILLALYFLKDWKNQELGLLFTLSACIFMLIGNVSMWATYYLTTQQGWVGQFLHGYILR